MPKRRRVRLGFIRARIGVDIVDPTHILLFNNNDAFLENVSGTTFNIASGYIDCHIFGSQVGLGNTLFSFDDNIASLITKSIVESLLMQNNTLVVSSNDTFPLDTRVRISFRQVSGGNYSAWLNGTQIIFNQSIGTVFNVSKLRIGKRSDNSLFLKGGISDIKLTSNTSTDADMLSVSTGNESAINRVFSEAEVQYVIDSQTDPNNVNNIGTASGWHLTGQDVQLRNLDNFPTYALQFNGTSSIFNTAISINVFQPSHIYIRFIPFSTPGHLLTFDNNNIKRITASNGDTIAVDNRARNAQSLLIGDPNLVNLNEVNILQLRPLNTSPNLFEVILNDVVIEDIDKRVVQLFLNTERILVGARAGFSPDFDGQLIEMKIASTTTSNEIHYVFDANTDVNNIINRGTATGFDATGTNLTLINIDDI